MHRSDRKREDNKTNCFILKLLDPQMCTTKTVFVCPYVRGQLVDHNSWTAWYILKKKSGIILQEITNLLSTHSFWQRKLINLRSPRILRITVRMLKCQIVKMLAPLPPHTHIHQIEAFVCVVLGRARGGIKMGEICNNVRYWLLWVCGYTVISFKEIFRQNPGAKVTRKIRSMNTGKWISGF